LEKQCYKSLSSLTTKLCGGLISLSAISSAKTYICCSKLALDYQIPESKKAVVLGYQSITKTCDGVQALKIAQCVLLIAVASILIPWIKQAVNNVWSSGARSIRYSPGNSKVKNIWLIFGLRSLLGFIWRASFQPQSWQSLQFPVEIKIWWGLIVFSFLAQVLLLVDIFFGTGLLALIPFSISLILEFVFILIYLLSIWIFTTIHRAQIIYRELNN